MSVAANFYRRFQLGQDFLEGTQVVSDGSELVISEDVAVSTTASYTCVLPYAKITGLWVSTTVDGMVVDFSGSTPAFTMTASTPIQWSTGCHMTCPITADTATVSVQNVSSTTVARVEIRVLFTPV